jgi:hypothetical protein
MRFLTKTQEEREQKERREVMERKLRYMGYRIAENMASKYEKDIEAPIPDLTTEIKRLAEDLAWADDVIV